MNRVPSREFVERVHLTAEVQYLALVGKTFENVARDPDVEGIRASLFEIGEAAQDHPDLSGAQKGRIRLRAREAIDALARGEQW